MDEQKKYEVIKALADHPDSGKERAALTLGCSLRHINRMLATKNQVKNILYTATRDADLPIRFWIK